MDAPRPAGTSPSTPHNGRAQLLARLALTLVVALVAVAIGAQVAHAGPVHAGGAAPRVLEAPLTGTVDPVMAEYVKGVIHRAHADGFDAVVFTIDTPGGLSTSMDDIVKTFLNEKDLPIFVYVGPHGAEAASAGVFITMASDVAAMAPATNIGSATPINSNGSDIGKDLRRKVINNAVARLRGIAREHGRNEQFAEDSIRSAANLTSTEARDQHVVEYVEPTLGHLLDDADGTKVKPKGLTLHTANAEVTHTDMPFSLRLLKLLIDPNILFLLFSGGLIGLVFELTHPGVFFPGVVGLIMLVTALFGFQVLPVTTAGIVFLVVAGVFFGIEVAYPTHGVLGVGGAISLFLGGLLLFRRDSPFAINLPELIVISLMFMGFFVFIVRKVIAARRQPAVTGRQLMIGAEAVVRSALAPAGSVYLQGEIWQARALDDSQAIASGRRVVVEDIQGLTVVVSDAGVQDPEPNRAGRADRPHTPLTTDASPDPSRD